MCQEQHGNLRCRARAQHLEHLEPRLPRHLPVEDDQIEGFRAQRIQQRAAAREGVNPVTRLLEQPRDAINLLGLVFQ